MFSTTLVKKRIPECAPKQLVVDAYAVVSGRWTPWRSSMNREMNITVELRSDVSE